MQRVMEKVTKPKIFSTYFFISSWWISGQKKHSMLNISSTTNSEFIYLWFVSTLPKPTIFPLYWSNLVTTGNMSKLEPEGKFCNCLGMAGKLNTILTERLFAKTDPENKKLFSGTVLVLFAGIILFFNISKFRCVLNPSCVMADWVKPLRCTERSKQAESVRSS